MGLTARALLARSVWPVSPTLVEKHIPSEQNRLKITLECLHGGGCQSTIKSRVRAWRRRLLRTAAAAPGPHRPGSPTLLARGAVVHGRELG